MMMERTECSETSAYKIQTPGIYPEESTHHCVMSTPVLLHAYQALLIGSVLRPDEGGSNVLRNVGIFLPPHEVASHNSVFHF